MALSSPPHSSFIPPELLQPCLTAAPARPKDHALLVFSALGLKLTSNPMLLGAMATELVWIWMILNLAPVQKVFNTASVELNELWILLPFPLPLFTAHELSKWRRRPSPTHCSQ